MIFILLTLLIISIDLISKFVVNKKIKEGQEIEIAEITPHKIYMSNVKNRGGAGGFLNGNIKLLNLLSFVSLGSVTKIYLNILRRKQKSILYKLSFSCVLGGAIGNILDRLRNKSVTDFIFVKYKTKAVSPKYESSIKSTPVFNLADFFIILGIILYIIRSIFTNKNTGSKSD